MSVAANPFVDADYRDAQDKFINSQNQLPNNIPVLWFTGLPQAGKTTIADGVAEILKERGWKVERLDGDTVRQHLTKDLGFSKEDRDENIRRVRSVAKWLNRGGICVIASFVSPYKKQREELRKNIENFVEIFCDAPLSVCEERDTKGMYEKARQKKISNFTGISDPYESPESPDVHLKTGSESIDDCVEAVVNYLKDYNS